MIPNSFNFIFFLAVYISFCIISDLVYFIIGLWFVIVMAMSLVLCY